ncbi:MAG: hypothetical protein RLZZ214_310 [Verrucomicrobiota bacterium]
MPAIIKLLAARMGVTLDPDWINGVLGELATLSCSRGYWMRGSNRLRKSNRGGEWMGNPRECKLCTSREYFS